MHAQNTPAASQARMPPVAAPHAPPSHIRFDLRAAIAAATAASQTATTRPMLPQPATQPAVPQHPKRARFVPFHQYTGTQRASAPRTHLLAEAITPPDGWHPRVHNLTDERELKARALEATRLVPALPMPVWQSILDEDAQTLRAWPPPKLLASQLDAICAIAGHERLATYRQHLYAFNLFCVVLFIS